MTTEDDFQRALDADPGDWQTRMVFADWLEDRGDRRAEGYRALGLGRHRTDTTTTNSVHEAFHWWQREWTFANYTGYQSIWAPVSLNREWFALIRGGKRDGQYRRDFTARRAAEDAAARAFAKLPAARRAELLTPPSPLTKKRKPKKRARPKSRR